MSKLGDMIAKQKHYQKGYNVWAGNEKGSEPDYDRCCVEVGFGERGARHRQCNRKCGHGPDGAYCKQHDPAVKAERDRKAKEAYDAKTLKWRYGFYGKSFYDALVKIAEGHNDARGLAQEIVNKFNERK